MSVEPLRFCMITTFFPPHNFGGDGIYVLRLSNELARRGHRVEVIHCLDSYHLGGQDPPTGTIELHPNVTVHGLRSGFGFLSPLATQQTGRPFFKEASIRAILDRGFDVIHFHNISLVGGPGLLALGRGIKLYTLHEYWLLCRNHVLFRNNREVCTRRRCLLCDLHYRRPPQWWRYTNLLEESIRHVRAFIAPSRFTLEIHREALPGLPLVHIPNPAPPEVPGEASVEEPADQLDGDPYFLCVGRLERLKGLQTVIPLFRRWEKARLVIAGAGGYEPTLRRLAGGSPRITFLGYMDRRALAGLYRGAVGVIFPSLCPEIAPLVILEAMSAGAPVIVRNIGSMPEIAHKSGGGLIYETEEQLESTMERLLRDPEHRRRLGRSGREACRSLWSFDTHLERYLALIAEIAARRGEGG
jgi:glycosyltransferase involved in cell wall biosynthesis